MKKLLKPFTLVVSTKEQLAVLQAALDSYFDFTNDTVLDDSITTVKEIHELHGMPDEEMAVKIGYQRHETDKAINRLLALQELRHKVTELTLT